MAKRVLDIEDLRVSFFTYAGEVQAVRGVTLHVDEGEVLAIVGESGCGKSVTAQTIMKLNPMPPAKIMGGFRQGDAVYPRERCGHDLPGSHDLYESHHAGGQTDCGGH